MRFSVVRTALAVLAGVAISSCSENPISTVNPVEVAAPQMSLSAGPQVVISQIYGGGGNAGATYKNDFIEIFNRGTTSVDLTGWSVQYASATGSTWQVTPLTGSILPGRYYLIQEAAGTGGTTALPQADATGTIPMGGTGGKVLLSRTTAALTGSTCPTGGNVVDIAGFGTGSNCGVTAAVANATAAIRKLAGCEYTATPPGSASSSDFVVGAPTPRNGASTPNPCEPVEPVTVDSVSISPLTATVSVGNSVSFTAKAYDADKNEIGGVAFSWSTSNPNATVSSTGIATGVTPGVVSIIVSSENGHAATAQLTVQEPTPVAPLVINELHANPANASGGASFGEWFEVYNYGTTDIDLQGWRIASAGASQPEHTIGTSVVVPAGGYAVLGRGLDFTRNGGVAINYNYFTGSATTIWLDDSDELSLKDPSGAVVDVVRWTGAATFGAGVSRALRDASVNNSDVNGANWGHSTTQFGDGDFGTPGAANGSLSDTPPALPNRISFSGRLASDAPLPVGFEDQLFATLRSGAGVTIPSTFTWEAVTPILATIDEDGVMHAHAEGTAVFRATAADGTTATYSLPMAVATAGNAQYANNAEFGEPTDADASDDYLVRRAQYTTSYNPVKNIPNWVSYNLEATHIAAGQDRCDCFTFDPELPASFFRYTTGDYTGAGAAWSPPPGPAIGIDRGHLARSFDRTNGSFDNATTYYFTNIIPQFSDNNQGPWALFENYLGAFAQSGTKEVYIIAGASGNQGTVKNEGKIVIPTQTWKVAVVMDRNEGLANVQSQSDIQVFAVIMPNTPGIRNNGWEMYKTTVDAVEAISGYDVLSLLEDNMEKAVESNTNVPIARADGPYTSSEGGSFSLSGAASSDADGDALTYTWSFGDGATATGSAVTHTYSQDGTYTVQLTVTDTRGISNTTSTTATVGNVGPSVTITHGATLLPGETYTSGGSFTDPGADTWSATADYGDGSGAAALALSGNNFTLAHQYNTAGTFTVTVGVSDDDATGTATQTVVVISQADAVDNLLELVSTNSLRVKLSNASSQIEAGNFTAAANMLEAFINEVEAMVKSGRLTSADGARLINDARRIIDSITP